MSMACPRCRDLLTEATIVGVVADTCATCHGTWLDRGELQELLTRADGFQRARNNGVHNTAAGAGFTTQRDRRPSRTGEAGFLPCPRCGNRLRETYGDGVRVDTCRWCRGVWLDGGELQRIKASLWDLRHDWERDDKDPEKSIRWDRPPRYPRHHPRRHLPPPIPPRESRRTGRIGRSLLIRDGSADGISGCGRPLDNAKPDESVRDRCEADAQRRRSVLGRVWNACRPMTGAILVIVGLIFTFVPVLPGTPLILVGMAVAGSSHPLVRFVRERWRRWTRKGA